MLKNNTRKILLKDSNYFISDRLIIESIARDFNFFRDAAFLERKFEESFSVLNFFLAILCIPFFVAASMKNSW